MHMTPEQFVSIQKTLMDLKNLHSSDERINQINTMARLHIETLLAAVQEAANVLKAQDDIIKKVKEDYRALEISYLNLAGE